MVERSRLDYAKHIGTVDARIETHCCGSISEASSASSSLTLSEALPATFKPGDWEFFAVEVKVPLSMVRIDIATAEARVLFLSLSFARLSASYILTIHLYSWKPAISSIITNNTAAYRDTKSRWEKSMIVNSIIESVRNSRGGNYGGFVKKDTRTGRWYQVGNKGAREKVSHALRDAVKVQRKNEARMRRYAAKLGARGLLSPTRRVDTVHGSTILSPSIHLYYNDVGIDPIGAIVSDDEDNDSLFSQNVELATFEHCANDEWEKSLQASTECFLKS
eukprot:CAMPEP_0113655444 /NCGR_PEP_ID=MMETSP0017_2-20120614/29716_1 /TAXON_ID=2856 /ORGANISM="Cylindrotheca closterium" /LENGTH=276 /DNA_ID=CAMNT_0000568705 /DNA_START=135 /DNA_END=963 /DNA_ORIENTATION=- /assembly_acc=CAM_ASM_000147